MRWRLGWQLTIAAMICGVVLALAIRVHQFSAEMKELSLMVHEVFTAQYDYKGTHYELISRPGETFPQFIARAERFVFHGEIAADSDFCWESDCTTAQGVPYHVKFCAPSQAALDAAVATYCASHNCEACRYVTPMEHHHHDPHDCALAFVLVKIERLEDRLDRIETTLTRIEKQGERMAQLSQEMRDLIAKFDAATNEQAAETARIGAKLAELLDRIANGISPAEGAELKAAFEQELADQAAVTASLKAIGADPANPIP